MTTADPGLRLELSAAQREARERFRAFTAEHVTPHAGAWDRAAAIPSGLVDALRSEGYLGSCLSEEVGGGGLEPITYGLLTEEIARGCSSVRSLLTVHDMVSTGVARWGSSRLKDDLLARFGRGEKLCALGLTEPGHGSDAAAVETRAVRSGDGDDAPWVVNGRKKWITFGRIADYVLVLARVPEEHRAPSSGFMKPDGTVALLVPTDAPGFRREPIRGMVGTRASMLAELFFDDCEVPAHHLVGREGFGFSHVINTVLDHGRYSVAWGSVGITQACLDASWDHAESREQFGVPIKEHQLVRRLLTDMITEARAARLLCLRAGWMRAQGDPSAAYETLIAKYFASRAAVRAANDAVQLHGANGLSEEYPVERYLRDAKVTEIIEGSTQIQQITIPLYPNLEL